MELVGRRPKTLRNNELSEHWQSVSAHTRSAQHLMVGAELLRSGQSSLKASARVLLGAITGPVSCVDTGREKFISFMLIWTTFCFVPELPAESEELSGLHTTDNSIPSHNVGLLLSGCSHFN